MKKYIIIALTLGLIWSCDDDKYARLNENPKQSEEVPADYLFTSSIETLGDQMASPNVNVNIFRFVDQYLTATTYLQEPNYQIRDRNIPEYQWTNMYTNILNDLENAKANVQDGIVNSTGDLTQEQKDARIAQISVLEVYVWQVLVDTFGDIPYTDAINVLEDTAPAYDDAATIYESLIEEMKANNDKLATQGFGAASDKIFGGDMGKWQKFSNSLLLRLGMRLSDVNETLSQDAVNTAVGNGVFDSNDDSALIEFGANPPNTNPLWEDLVQSGRSDYVVANTIVNKLNDLEDPRRQAYFDDNLDGAYDGGTYGGSNTYSEYTHIGSMFREPTHPGILMDYAEVEFLLAEAAEEGGYSVSGTQGHYEAGIEASIKYWGGSQSDADDYMTQSDVAFDGTNANELIATQFWIAMYDNPFQGWYVIRKFDAPDTNLPAATEAPLPLRYTYPINEQNLNKDNYDDAASAIGGDTQQTPLFWDVN